MPKKRFVATLKKESDLAKQTLWKSELEGVLEEWGLEIDKEKMGDLSVRETQHLLSNLAYLLLYIVKDERGLPADSRQAHAVITEQYSWLIAMGNYKNYTMQNVYQQATRRANQLWEETFDGRRNLAAQRFRDRVREIDRVMPAVLNAILRGDLDRVQDYVALAKLDAATVGYQAPTRYEIGASSGDILTEEDKKLAQQAAIEVKDYEAKLLADKKAEMEEVNVIEGEFEEK